ncbi:ABC transporter permease [Pectinatus frisingensis]|uniref:ABC transporter permease n=1 Tax=Pectinatus frisingensis TaxID=865 RepID=UPI0018C5D4FF|nr:ABC transporter permease [Pectinatus frisingensis]
MINYFIKNFDMFGTATLEHLWIVAVTLAISVLLSTVLSYALLRVKYLEDAAIQLFSAIYSIPSLALFALMIPVMGLGNMTAVVVLTLYNQFLLLRNILSGMNSVDKNLLEAATGMGMTNFQVVTRVQLPLAFPTIIAGIRLAIISTTGIATIAACINAGGLGTVLFSGMRTMNVYKIVWGTILCAVIVLIEDLLLKMVERKLRRGAC